MKKSYYWTAVKYGLTLLLIILLPVYWHYYGPQNFLWLSDISLFLTIAALWIHSPMLMSIATIGAFVFELGWNVDFFADLFFGMNPIDLADYMFNSALPLWLRAISLFHVAMPVVWICYLTQFGYNKKAFAYAIPGYWAVLTATYFLTDPARNINWVFIPLRHNLTCIPHALWPVLLGTVFPFLIFLPTHLICKRFFTQAEQID